MDGTVQLTYGGLLAEIGEAPSEYEGAVVSSEADGHRLIVGSDHFIFGRAEEFALRVPYTDVEGIGIGYRSFLEVLGTHWEPRPPTQSNGITLRRKGGFTYRFNSPGWSPVCAIPWRKLSPEVTWSGDKKIVARWILRMEAAGAAVIDPQGFLRKWRKAALASPL